MLYLPYDPRLATGIKMWESYLILICILIIMHGLACFILTFTKQKYASLKVEKGGEDPKAITNNQAYDERDNS